MWSRRLARQLAIAACTAALLGVVVVAGQIPLGRPSDNAVLRLSLRTVRTRVEVCRDRTEQELADLPAHMRQPEVCESFSPTYRLTVTADGEEIVDLTADAGGLRGDRPLIVSHELPVPPGRTRLEVSMLPIAVDDLDEDAEQAFAGIPRYRLEQTVEMIPDRITLVLLDEEKGELVVYGDSG